VTPDTLAALHAAAFFPERGWSEAEFTTLCAAPNVYLYTQGQGFALLRVAAEEAELLTLAVAPQHRRKGVADALMTRWMLHCPAKVAFLEVAADNTGALALYHKHGFARCGLRKGYYRRPDAASVDAVLMRAALTPCHDAE
jgi:ribosomal-protein-alanine N-acetyltransferase